MVYDQKEVKEACLAFFHNEELSANVCMNKYLLRDREGNFLEKSPHQIIDRVMSALASVDNREDKEEVKKEFIEACNNFVGVCPQGSVLFGAGNLIQNVSLSNCFAIDSPEDSIEGINDIACMEQQIMKRRGGVGVDISTLRPSGTPTNNSSLTSSGAVGWANYLSEACRAVGQNNRRGALMISMHIQHPDSEAFAKVKSDLTKVTAANLSLKLTDEFMKAVRKDSEFNLQWPVESDNPKVTRTIKARDLWKTIYENAWKMAEPGILMWDNIIKNLPAHCYKEFYTISTNPCSEIPLSALDSCRLISICLLKYVKNPFEKEAEFDFDLFKKDVKIAMRMADNLVELELKHIKKIISISGSDTESKLWKRIYKAGELGRRTGLGTHGLADALTQLRMKYDSEDAIKFFKKLYKTLRDESYLASVELAKERGAFPVFDWTKEKDCEFIKRLPEDIQNLMKKQGRRNISLLTMAPTGSISIISGNCSSGIEPVFKNFYTRRRKIESNDTTSRVDFVDALGDKWQEYKIFHPNVKRYLEKNTTSEKELPNFFVESHNIDWKKRIELQGIIQQFIDHSISSTINLPSDVTPETIGDLYMLAWENGLKGVTVYREGCRDGVLIAESTTQKKKPDERPDEINYRT